MVAAIRLWSLQVHLWCLASVAHVALSCMYCVGLTTVHVAVALQEAAAEAAAKAKAKEKQVAGVNTPSKGRANRGRPGNAAA